MIAGLWQVQAVGIFGCKFQIKAKTHHAQTQSLIGLKRTFRYRPEKMFPRVITQRLEASVVLYEFFSGILGHLDFRAGKRAVKAVFQNALVFLSAYEKSVPLRAKSNSLGIAVKRPREAVKTIVSDIGYFSAYGIHFERPYIEPRFWLFVRNYGIFLSAQRGDSAIVGFGYVPP